MIFIVNVFMIWCIMILDCLRFVVLYRKKEFIEIKNIFCWIFFFYKKINNLFVW